MKSFRPVYLDLYKKFPWFFVSAHLQHLVKPARPDSIVSQNETSSLELGAQKPVTFSNSNEAF